MPQTLVKETSDTPLPLAESALAAGSGRVFSPVNITQLDTDEEEEEASFKSSSGRPKADSVSNPAYTDEWFESSIMWSEL